VNVARIEVEGSKVGGLVIKKKEQTGPEDSVMKFQVA